LALISGKYARPLAMVTVGADYCTGAKVFLTGIVRIDQCLFGRGRRGDIYHGPVGLFIDANVYQLVFGEICTWPVFACCTLLRPGLRPFFGLFSQAWFSAFEETLNIGLVPNDH
jgi:hypothetical protein